MHLVQYIAPYTISYLFRYIYKKYQIHHLPFFPMSLIILPISFLGGALWIAFSYFLVFCFYGTIFIQNIFRDLIQPIFYDSYALVTWSVVYIGYKFYQEFIVQKQNAERAIILAQSTQLEMLRYQINPHFLFNTLNSARALVLADPPLAREMLTQISEFLRYSLSEGKNSTVPLVREMEAINNYLEIEKIRYKDNLIVEYQIDPIAEDFNIPVFLILPLVENAIKHGMKSTTLPLKINLNAKVIEDYLQIDVVNTGKWNENIAKDLNTGTGLNNVKKRLENSYGNNFHFEILKNDDFIHVVMKIKKER
ncbi:MAG: histidine kinase [Melioribacteraceae bacterium]